MHILQGEALQSYNTLALAGHERLIGGMETVLGLRGVKDDKTKILAKYMSARFSLTKNDKPHAMRF